MKRRLWIIAVAGLLAAAGAPAQTLDSLPPAPAIHTTYTLALENEALVFRAPGLEGPATLTLNGETIELDFRGGQAFSPLETDRKGRLLLIGAEEEYRLYHAARTQSGYRLRHIPLWTSILPPLVAIFLALVFREVIVSLFAGVWVGAFLAGGLRVEAPYYFLLSILEVVQKYIINALNDDGHLSVIVFSMLIGGMVAIISRNGGMAGIVNALSRYARSARSSQFVTWLLGMAIFFDDYANTLIVGNTMRPVTDKFRVSREKLAYIVDSTAAPVAAIAFITTWIGAELGYIDDGIGKLDNFAFNLTPYAIFFQSLKYAFYPLLSLIFILLLVYFRRDYGPMYRAEKRARETGRVSNRAISAGGGHIEDLDPVPGAPIRWYNAFIPVSLVILMTLYGLIDTGLAATYADLAEAGLAPAGQSWSAIWSAMNQLPGNESASFPLKLGQLIGNSDSYVALLWASLTGVLAAAALTVGGRIMNLGETVGSMITGFKTMLPALMILTLAWSLAATTEELHTATYLTAAIKGVVNPYAMPAIVFVLAAIISFSTGSSWGTMAILYPIAIPITWAIAQDQGLEAGVSLEILLNVIATVLAASVMGDHCSPISDTTILSSLASDCHHIDHVRTQLPYALTVGGVAISAGVLSTLLGGGWLVCFVMLALSMGVLLLVILRFGKRVEHASPSKSRLS
jgi:Na+/H+ antiporter NhaC